MQAKDLEGYNELDYIAKHIIDGFEQTEKPTSYIGDKIERLSGQSKYDSLFYALHSLDGKHQAILATKLDLDVKLFPLLLTVFQKI